MRVAVCALTYLRPVGLRRLLTGLSQLECPDGTVVRVFVVDNDADHSAVSVVDELRPTFPDGLTVVNEPARSISLARNAAVREALAWSADCVCFIDDDEWPERQWLSELLESQAATQADVVTGPVLAVFDVPPPSWVVEGRFFDRPRYGHNQWIGYATTSNVLIMADCFAGRLEPFDPSFGLSGGEDTHFFAQLVDEGRRIVWCDRAPVSEAIPASRVDERWILRREYRRGQTLSLSLRQRDARVVRYVRRIGNAAVHVVTGCALSVVGLVRGRSHVLHGLKEICFGCGMVSGLTGRRYQEYQSVHGT